MRNVIERILPRRAAAATTTALVAALLASATHVVSAAAAPAVPAPPGAAAASPNGNGQGGGNANAAPAAGAPAAGGTPAPANAPATGSPDAGAAGSGEAPARPKGNTVRLVIRTVPGKRAFVYWGKKKLGVTDKKAPLIIQRPRDSGPLDLLVRADDCVPVYTRAYTFDDSTLAVKVTPLDQKQTLFGYKAELPPEDAAAGDVAAPGADPLPGAPAAGGRPGGGLFTR